MPYIIICPFLVRDGQCKRIRRIPCRLWDLRECCETAKKGRRDDICMYMADSPDQRQLKTQKWTHVASELKNTYPINRTNIGVS